VRANPKAPEGGGEHAELPVGQPLGARDFRQERPEAADGERVAEDHQAKERGGHGG